MHQKYFPFTRLLENWLFLLGHATGLLKSDTAVQMHGLAESRSNSHSNVRKYLMLG